MDRFRVSNGFQAAFKCHQGAFGRPGALRHRRSTLSARAAARSAPLGEAAAAAAQRPGTFHTIELLESAHVAPRRVDIWIPGGPSVPRPLLVMQDGQNVFDPEKSFAGVPWGADAALLRLQTCGALAGAPAGAPLPAVAAVWNTPRRMEEYMPPVPGLDTHKLALGADGAGVSMRADGDAYVKFLAEELVPLVGSMLPAPPGPQHTAVMGSSMGGLISLWAMMQYPEVFGAAACLSTHWPAAGGAFAEWLVDGGGWRRVPDRCCHRIYFDRGTEGLDAEYAPFQQRVDDVMTTKAGYNQGVHYASLVFEGAAHDEAAWSKRLHVPLAFLYAARQPGWLHAMLV